MFKKPIPMFKKLEISPKDLNKPLLNYRSSSPHLRSLNCLDPMFKKHGTAPKRLRQVHFLFKKPMPRKEESP
jgi:hypothetical protein